MITAEGADLVAAFLAMGGYGGYVWAAFGITAAALATLLLVSWRSARRLEAELAHWRERSRDARRPRRPLQARREGLMPARDPAPGDGQAR
jgi:heme exporter protein D